MMHRGHGPRRRPSDGPRRRPSALMAWATSKLLHTKLWKIDFREGTAVLTTTDFDQVDAIIDHGIFNGFTKCHDPMAKYEIDKTSLPVQTLVRSLTERGIDYPLVLVQLLVDLRLLGDFEGKVTGSDFNALAMQLPIEVGAQFLLYSGMGLGQTNNRLIELFPSQFEKKKATLVPYDWDTFCKAVFNESLIEGLAIAVMATGVFVVSMLFFVHGSTMVCTFPNLKKQQLDP